MRGSHESGGRGPALLLAAAALASLSNFAFHAVGSRLLGPDSYSSLAALLALLVIVAVPIGAVQTSVTQASAGSNNASAITAVERASHAGLFILVAGLAAAIPLDRMLELHDPWGVALTAAWAAVACLSAVAKGSLLGRLRYTPVAIALVAGAITRVLLAIVFVPMLRVEGAMLATLLGEAVAACIALSAMRGSLLSLKAASFLPRGTDATMALGVQLGLWLLAGVTTMVGRRVLPDAQAGNFAAASTLTNAATFLPLAVATAFFPRFTRANCREELTRAFTIATILGGGTALALTIAPTMFIHLLAGSSFSADPLVVGMPAFASALVGIVGVAVFFLLARRRASALSIWLGAGMASIGALLVHDDHALALVALMGSVIAAVVTVMSAYRASDASPEPAKMIGLPDPDRLVTVVVPSYNGGARLRPTIDALCRSLDTTGWSYEVLVQVDGSDDFSERTLAGVSKNVLVEISPVNEGKGAALRRGFARARGVYIGFIDGDGDIDVDIVRRLARACQRPGVWAAIASKHAEGADVQMSLTRATLSAGYRRLVRLLFGLDVSDTQCGAKMFSRRGLERALPWARERGFAVDVELLGLGRRLGLGEIVELPVRLSRDQGTTVSPLRALRTLEETLRVWGRVLEAPVVLTIADSAGIALASIDVRADGVAAPELV
jgi:O-antigen/teichoic acid export membrane protein